MRRTVVRSFSLPPALLAELEQCAADESRTYSELVREAVRHYLRQREQDAVQMHQARRAAGMQ